MNQKKRVLLLGAVSLLGLLIGTALPELFRMGTGTYAGLFSMYSFQRFEHTTAGFGKLFPYLAMGRLETLLFLWLSACTPAGMWFHAAYLFWLASSAGLLLSLFILRDGYEGILLFLCCIFPQWLVYASALKKELLFFLRQRMGSWEGERLSYAAIQRRELLELARMAGICLFGCAVEAYLGVWTLKIFLRLLYFVE